MYPDSHKLPTELLHQIILAAVVNSIHSIGTSRGTQWDIRIFTILSSTSPLFGAIVHDVVGNVFGLDDGDGMRDIIIDGEKLMHEFYQLGEPEEWPEIARNYPEQYPSHIFNAYALLTCVICLRGSATDSSVPTFLATQAAAKTALRQVKLWPIATPEIAVLLYSRTGREQDLAVGGTTLVRSCVRVEELLDQILTRNHKSPPTSPLSPKEEELKYAELNGLLRIIETAATKFDHDATFIEAPQPKAVQLPGVAQTLRGVFGAFSDNQSSFDSPIRDLLSHWINDACHSLTDFDFGYPISLSFIY